MVLHTQSHCTRRVRHLPLSQCCAPDENKIFGVSFYPQSGLFDECETSSKRVVPSNQLSSRRLFNHIASSRSDRTGGNRFIKTTIIIPLHAMLITSVYSFYLAVVRTSSYFLCFPYSFCVLKYIADGYTRSKRVYRSR